jgi:hypothetical protein
MRISKINNASISPHKQLIFEYVEYPLIMIIFLSLKIFYLCVNKVSSLEKYELLFCIYFSYNEYLLKSNLTFRIKICSKLLYIQQFRFIIEDNTLSSWISSHSITWSIGSLFAISLSDRYFYIIAESQFVIHIEFQIFCYTNS